MMCVSVAEPPDGQKSLERFCDGLDKFTQFRTFRELVTLTYGDPTNNCCIVSSIEFDRDGEFFAVAGVTKKIKVCTVCVCVIRSCVSRGLPPHVLRCLSMRVL